FPAVVMIQVTMDATFVAAIREVEMHAPRDVQIQRPLHDALHECAAAHRASAIGFSATYRMPCAANARTKSLASANASSAVTSNARQIFSSTIVRNGVLPSAACQISAPASFNVNSVESTADITTISSPSR